MAFDGLTMRFLIEEMAGRLIGARVEKIYQPDKYELDLFLKTRTESILLHISVDPSMPYFCLTEVKSENPAEPPMFCMLMRKHLSGAKIVGISQPGLERVLKIDFETRNELGDVVHRQLVTEIMGKHSNVILIDLETDNTVMDSVKRIPEHLSSVRPILPGLKYSALPSDRLSLVDSTVDHHLLCETLNKAADAARTEGRGKDLKKFLYTTLEGFSPTQTAQILVDYGVDPEMKMMDLEDKDAQMVAFALIDIKTHLISHHSEPCMIVTEVGGHPVDFTAILPKTLPMDAKLIWVDSVNTCINRFYVKRNKDNVLKNKAANLRKAVQSKADSLKNKMVKLKEERLEAMNSETYKVYGELILANMYAIEPGSHEITVQNYYSEEAEDITLKLDMKLTPAENSQKYYRKYNKMKTALIEIDKQLIEATEDLEYLDSVLVAIDATEDTQNLEDIAQELGALGIIKKRYSKNKNKKKKDRFEPYQYTSSDGQTILVGKNSLQNDRLTLKEASNSDLWFHTKDIPGSHVVIRSDGTAPSETTIFEAALIAAWHSKGKMSSQVPVDYTQIRHVHKPAGAKPGMVIYEHQKTIYVTPDETMVAGLRK